MTQKMIERNDIHIIIDRLIENEIYISIHMPYRKYEYGYEYIIFCGNFYLPCSMIKRDISIKNTEYKYNIYGSGFDKPICIYNVKKRVYIYMRPIRIDGKRYLRNIYYVHNKMDSHYLRNVEHFRKTGQLRKTIFEDKMNAEKIIAIDPEIYIGSKIIYGGAG
jgi:hypothetical protein